jgi:hypothetical protein
VSAVYVIPQTLASQYNGCGWALAASVGGQIVALRYIDDVASDEVADAVRDGGPRAPFFLRQWLNTNEAGQVVRELQALGGLHVGMCSAWEFVEQ